MDNPYTRRIAAEREKIALLRAKIEECEQRIAALLSLTEDDELDQLLAKKVGDSGDVKKQQNDEQDTAAVADLPKEVTSEEPARLLSEVSAPKRVLSDKTLKLLRFASTQDKSVAEFFEYARANNLMVDRARVRNFLNLYKVTYGLLDSRQQGYYHLSNRGITYLKALEASSSNKEGNSPAK